MCLSFLFIRSTFVVEIKIEEMKKQLSEKQIFKMLQKSKARHLNLEALLKENFCEKTFPKTKKKKSKKKNKHQPQ